MKKCLLTLYWDAITTGVPRDSAFSIILEKGGMAFPGSLSQSYLKQHNWITVFQCKEWSSQYSAVQRFTKSHGYVDRLDKKAHKMILMKQMNCQEFHKGFETKAYKTMQGKK